MTGENIIHEEATEAELITEGTTESIDETTAYNNNEIKVTTDIISIETAEEYNSIDDEAIDEESNLIQLSPNLVQDQKIIEESERIEQNPLKSLSF